MSKKEASPISLENLKNDIQSFVERVADEAIQQSEKTLVFQNMA